MRLARNPAFIILVLVAIYASPLFGQQQPKPSSPEALRGPETTEDARWWTLTDEITPEELRAIHEDVELHKERHRKAVEAGIQPPKPKQQMELLNFFIDGNTHPELFQMWLVYSSFAAGFVYDAGDPRESLAEFGFEGEVLETIVRLSTEFWREREILQEKVEEEFKAVRELIRLSKEKLGQENYEVAIKAKDATMLANATGYSVEKVEKLLKLWREETPAEDLTVQTLPQIKKVLGPTDWERFRSYLLEVRAPNMLQSGHAVVEEN